MSVFDELSSVLEKSTVPETSVFDEMNATLKTSDGWTFPTTEHPIQISAIGGHPFR